MKILPGAIFVLTPLNIITFCSAEETQRSPIVELPAFAVTDSEISTAQTPDVNACRILGKLFTMADVDAPVVESAPHSMSQAQVLDTHEVKEGDYTTMFKKVKPPQRKKVQENNFQQDLAEQ